MKKSIFCIILLLCLLGIAGCKKKEIFLTNEDITSSTMLVKRNGELQVAFVEEFDKPYYNLSEMTEFVKKEVSAYNKKAGSEAVKIDKLGLLQNDNKKAIMILTFSGMEHYCTFNNTTAAYFTANTKNVTLELPEQYISVKNGASVDKAEAFKSGKNKALVVYEPYDIIVEGSIKYYSNNAALVDKNKAQSNGKDAAVVIFKP